MEKYTLLMKRYFPFLKWFPLSKQELRSDAVAGIVVALLLIPQSMAYAELTGLPIEYGLYTCIVPVTFMSLFGNIRQMAYGPSAMTAIITAAVLMPMVKDLPPEIRKESYISLAILLSLFVGIFKLILGIFKLSSVVNLISYPVISGFTNAAAIVIALSQLANLKGIKEHHIPHQFGGLVKASWGLIYRLNEVHVISFLLGVSAIIILVFGKKVSKKVPWALIIVILSCALFRQLKVIDPDLIVGEIPQSLPHFVWPFVETLPIVKLFPHIIMGALMITVIGFIETVSIGKAISFKTRTPINFNQELIGQGVGGLAGSFFQAFPISGSLSRSALNLNSGAKTPISNLFTVVALVLVLLFLTPALHYLPKATLAALIISSIFGLVDFKAMNHAWKFMKREGLVAFFTFGITLAFAPNIIKGFLAGVLLSIILYLYRTMTPDTQIYDWGENCPKKFRNRSKEIAIIRFRCAIFFASMEAFEETVIEALADAPESKYIIIEGQSINRIDASGEWGLRSLTDQLRTNRITLMFAGLPQISMQNLKQNDLDQLIGKENFFKSTEEAIQKIHEDINFDKDILYTI